MNNKIQKIEEIINNSDFSLIGSLNSAGFLIMKYLLPPKKRIGLKYLYFTTNTTSVKIKKYKNNPKVSLFFYDKVSFDGVILKGIIEVIEDSASKEMFMKNENIINFPLEIKDLDYCILKFTANKGRKYSNSRYNDFLIKPE